MAARRRLIMCGRYMATSSPHDLAEEFAVDEIQLDDEIGPRWNVAPTLPVLAVAESRTTGRRRLGTFRWGLVPSWAENASSTTASRMINARAETVATKPAFRTALARRRCIIPADGFYEWRNKQPYPLARPDGRPPAVARPWGAGG